MTNTSSGGMFGKLINPETGQAKSPAPQQQGDVQPVISPSLHTRLTEGSRKTDNAPKQQQHTPAPVAHVEELRLTLPLPPELVLFLDQFERTIFSQRPQKFRSRQRLTKNSIIRAWLAVLQDMQVNITSIEDEQDLLRRFKDAVVQHKKA